MGSYMNHYWKAIYLTILSFGFLINLKIQPIIQYPMESMDLGWNAPVNLTFTDTDSKQPSLVADPYGNVHLIWVEVISQQVSTINYCQIIDGGCNNVIDIIATPGITGYDRPSVACDSRGFLHIVYTANNRLYYSNSHVTDAGSAGGWTSPKIIYYANNFLSDPSLSIGPDDILYVVFPIEIGPESGILVLISNDNGRMWSGPYYVYSNNNLSLRVSNPRVDVDQDGQLHTVWTVTNFPETYPPIGIQYSSSKDGINWEPAKDIAVGPYAFPEIMVDKHGRIHVVYTGTSTDRFEFHTFSIDSGKNWSVPWRNEFMGGTTGYPSIVEDSSGKLYWLQVGDVFSLNEKTNNTALVVHEYEDNKWSEGVILLKSSIPENHPMNVTAVVASGNQLHVAVSNPLPRIGGGYQFDIFYFFRSLNTPIIPTANISVNLIEPTSEKIIEIEPTPTSSSPVTHQNYAIRNGAVIELYSSSFAVIVGTASTFAFIFIIVLGYLSRRRHY